MGSSNNFNGGFNNPNSVFNILRRPSNISPQPSNTGGGLGQPQHTIGFPSPLGTQTRPPLSGGKGGQGSLVNVPPFIPPTIAPQRPTALPSPFNGLVSRPIQGAIQAPRPFAPGFDITNRGGAISNFAQLQQPLPQTSQARNQTTRTHAHGSKRRNR